MTSEVFRLHTARGNGNSGGGHVEIYDNRAAFEHDLLLACTEVAAHAKTERGVMDWDSRRAMQNEARAHRHWLKWFHRNGEDEETGAHYTECIVAAQQFIDGEWLDLSYQYSGPRLTVSLGNTCRDPECNEQKPHPVDRHIGRS